MVVPSFRIYLGRPTRRTKTGERCVTSQRRRLKEIKQRANIAWGKKGRANSVG